MATSKAKFENVTFITLNSLNILCYLLVIVGSFMNTTSGRFAEIVLNVYSVLMCIALIFNEIKTPDITREYFRFLCVYRGRGLLCVFCVPLVLPTLSVSNHTTNQPPVAIRTSSFGCVVLHENVFNIIVAIFSFTLGLIYLILSYTSLDPLLALIVNYQNWKDLSTELPQTTETSKVIDSAAEFYLNDVARNTSPISGPTLSPTANGLGLDFGQSNGTIEIKRALSDRDPDSVTIITGDMGLVEEDGRLKRHQSMGQDSDYGPVVGGRFGSSHVDREGAVPYQGYMPNGNPYNANHDEALGYRVGHNYTPSNYGNGYATNTRTGAPMW
ncbi:LOW QUALITY PROTEIN: hypothetical protein BC936DRAFT_141367 [Jimgerdemannia flammicorona]|uniref:COPI associated protein-domain-containing protein n=1 Tax=Jimgerdemannia flammicorona TaxID=994334 RepID=A0A433DG63_9FUNG|nr:LOW QUALITY PROTEIN: hypothetical protein BC936DRAFT_141367 [Jimgerdemannia flammicorona]